MKLTGHSPKVRVGGPGKTVEEHIQYLQNQIDWLKEDLNDEVKHIKDLLHSAEHRANKEMAEIRTSIGSVNQIIKEVSIGGIGWQVFGVLLMIHGAVASYLA